MSAGEKIHHEGPCSDCSVFVDTRSNGDCYAGAATVQGQVGAVYLVCSPCAERRNRDPSRAWKPGPKHDQKAIQVMPSVIS